MTEWFLLPQSPYNHHGHLALHLPSGHSVYEPQLWFSWDVDSSPFIYFCVSSEHLPLCNSQALQQVRMVLFYSVFQMRRQGAENLGT